MRSHAGKEPREQRSASGRTKSISGVFRLKSSHRQGLVLGNRYEIIGLLDHGGTSEVYLASDTVSSTPVIVKWLTEEAGREPQHSLRFVVGAETTMSIDHPAVARVYCVEVPQDTPPYLVMEALQGESLAAHLRRHEKLSFSLTLQFAREIAAGLGAAHDKGIIHRDIKPGNLFLVGGREEPQHVKIIDFGLAKDLRSSNEGPPSRNLVLGTAQYMAPEQVLADRVDARTDIYAFGVVLFRMLTGQLPFDLDPGVDLFSHQLFSPAPPPSWLVEDVDPRFEQLILRCMRKHPENRYPSMQSVLSDLDAIIADPEGQSSEFVVHPLKRDPDVYKPIGSKSRDVATDLAHYFGAETPPPPTSRAEPSSASLEEHQLEESFPLVRRL